VLARANRVVRPEEFRVVVRRGRRSVTPSAIYYQLDADADDPLRFGFIVARTVGSAVDRNRVRRRLRALGRQFVDAGGRRRDVVVRALPGSAQRSWDSLSADMHAALDPREPAR
jgi:ribonuclease P protein component